MKNRGGRQRISVCCEWGHRLGYGEGQRPLPWPHTPPLCLSLPPPQLMIHNSFLCFNGPDAHTGSVLAVHTEGCTQVLSVKSAQCAVSLTIQRLLWELEACSSGRLVCDSCDWCGTESREEEGRKWHDDSFSLSWMVYSSYRVCFASTWLHTVLKESSLKAQQLKNCSTLIKNM